MKNLMDISSHMPKDTKPEDSASRYALEPVFKNLINDMFDYFPSKFRGKCAEKWAKKLLGEKNVSIEIVEKTVDAISESDHCPGNYKEFRNAIHKFTPNVVNRRDGEENARAARDTKLYKQRRKRFIEKYGKEKLESLTKIYYTAVFGKKIDKSVGLGAFEQIFLSDFSIAMKEKKYDFVDDYISRAIELGKEALDGIEKQKKGTSI